jgi:ABC-type phosphate transport system substrate-binding protein
MKKFLFVLTFLGLAAVARAEDPVFIANPDVTTTSISADEAKSILLGTKSKWDSGALLKLAVLTTGAVHDKVIKDYTQRTADQFDKYWKKQVFTGKGTMPATPKSDAEMIEFVAKTPGAFGYVDHASVTAQVKVLEIK